MADRPYGTEASGDALRAFVVDGIASANVAVLSHVDAIVGAANAETGAALARLNVV